MNHSGHGWQNAGAFHGATDPDATASPHAAQAEGMAAGATPGYGPHGPWPYPPGMEYATAWPGGPPPWSWYPPPPHGMGPQPYGYGYGFGPYGPGSPPGYAHGPGQPWPPQGHASPDPEQQGFGAAMGNIADQAGLGMLKDFFNFGDGEFWKGATVGAAVVLLLTNEHLRETLMGGAAKAAEAAKSGMDNLSGDEQGPDANAGFDAPTGQDDSGSTPEDAPR